ncbi:MAG: McrC family protein [bacterium]
MTLETISLTEYEPRRLPADALEEDVGRLLWQQYDRELGVLHVAFPSPRTGRQWELTSRGWVGHIPLGRGRRLALQPRAPLDNVLRMLALVYDLQSFHLLDGLVGSETLSDVYERLAALLARRVLVRARQGFYSAYEERTATLPYVRGRLEPVAPRANGAQPQVRCRFDEATTDVVDNQILAWTLRCIAHSGLCANGAQALVRRAAHSLDGVARALPVSAEACARRRYHRLNEDYRPLHALCRFFLEQSGPNHRQGDRDMLPFLVNMPRLYEQFVARWLHAHLPAPWLVRAQERVALEAVSSPLTFQPDLVLYDGAGAARMVLDTKYKTPQTPAAGDVAQVVAYAESKGCREAALVYPRPLSRPMAAQVGDVRVRALHFELKGDLQARGRAFLQQLGHPLWAASTPPA